MALVNIEKGVYTTRMEKKKRGPGRPRKEKPKAKEGRPPKYDPETHPKTVEALAKAGLGNESIAQALNIAESTLYVWKKQYSEFSEALKSGKEWPDDLVEAALFQRATGYSYPAVKIFMPAGAEKPVYAKYTEHVPPDPNAAEFWLTNRRKTKWAHKQQITGEGGAPLSLTIEYVSKKE
jgi:transposase-like protein